MSWLEIIKQERSRIPAKEAYCVYVDGNVNEGAVMHTLAGLHQISEQSGTAADLQLGFTDVLLKEHTQYTCDPVSFRNDKTLKQLLGAIETWRSDAASHLAALDAPSPRPAEIVQNLRGDIARAETLIRNDLAFFVRNKAVFLDKQIGTREGFLAAATRTVNALDARLKTGDDASAEIAECNQAFGQLGRQMESILPMLCALSQKHPQLIRQISPSLTGIQLNETFNNLVTSSIMLRLQAAAAQRPDGSVPFTPELRQAYSNACQYIGHYDSGQMRGLETLGLHNNELQQSMRAHGSYAKALTDRGIPPDQPVMYSLRKRVINVKDQGAGTASKIQEALIRHEQEGQTITFSLSEGQQKRTIPAEQVHAWANGTKSFPAGATLLIEIAPRTFPMHPEKATGLPIEPIRLRQLDEHIESQGARGNDIVSIDILKPKHYGMGAMPVPANPVLEKHHEPRLKVLAAEGRQMMNELREQLFNLRNHGDFNHYVKLPAPPQTAADISDNAIIGAIARRMSSTANMANFLQLLFYNTPSTQAFIGTLSNKGPYGDAKFNSGENSVFEMPILERQAVGILNDDVTSERARAHYSGGEMSASAKEFDRLLKRTTRNYAIFVSEDVAAKEEGHATLRASTDGHIPTTSMRLLTFSVLMEVIHHTLAASPLTNTPENAGLLADTAQHLQTMRQGALQKFASHIDKASRESFLQQQAAEYAAATKEVIAYYEGPPATASHRLESIHSRCPLASQIIEQFEHIQLGAYLKALTTKRQAPPPPLPGNKT